MSEPSMAVLFYCIEEMRKQSGSELVHLTVLENDFTVTFEKEGDKFIANANLVEIAKKGQDIYSVLRGMIHSATRAFHKGRVH